MLFRSVYTVTGNHEIVDASRYESPFDRVADELRGHNDDIVYGDGDRSYFYFDDNSSKIRYIGLSTFGLYQNGDCESCYTKEQLDWFKSIALNVETGWTIVIFTHALYYVDSSDKMVVGVTGASEFIETIDNYDLITAFKNFNLKHDNALILIAPSNNINIYDQTLYSDCFLKMFSHGSGDKGQSKLLDNINNNGQPNDKEGLNNNLNDNKNDRENDNKNAENEGASPLQGMLLLNEIKYKEIILENSDLNQQDYESIKLNIKSGSVIVIKNAQYLGNLFSELLNDIFNFKAEEISSNFKLILRPDDIAVVLLHDDLQPEQVWVRGDYLAEQEIRGELLNEPNQDFGVHMGDSIRIIPYKGDGGRIVCYSPQQEGGYGDVS